MILLRRIRKRCFIKSVLVSESAVLSALDGAVEKGIE